MYAYFVGRV